MTELIAAAGFALLAGLLIGWLIASRRSGALASDLAVAQSRSADADLIRKARDEVERERNEAHQLVAGLRAETAAHEAALLKSGQQIADLVRRAEAAEAERSQHASDLAAHRAQSAAREEAHEANLVAMRTHFEAAAGKALETAQTKFLDRAHQRFAESEKLQGEKIAQLLQPVSERLTRYEETVTKVEQERRTAFGELDGQIKAMRDGQERVSTEAARLVNALRNAPKARGRWGEQQLRNVLETCGLAEHTDFAMEVSVADGEGGRLRPDAIVRVPGGKSLIIDAKVSLNAYQDAFNAIDDAERLTGLKAHALSMRTHVNGLSGKSYWSQFDDTPEYVVMFVPGEHFLNAALEHDPDLWDFAFNKRVLLATPTNLIAIARTVDAVWKQEKLATEAREIGALGKEIYARIQVMAHHLGRMSRSLDDTVENYNKFVGSLDSNVLTTAKKLEAYKMDGGGKLIETPAAIERTARGSAKLIAVGEAVD
ncbi:MAG: recombination protein RmuC [Sphingomonas bacterium]|uniref:DNA recombination protein RmuC n=1 Tax=Sphingomonas bacterium TaxID=1895847 RepID=UPI002612BA2D|nr:DNA recombination protein RmuC [Sphingomonas bacterium]MDB5695632.1 recombination protein RmuC [Sphingomonas bacterium]